MLLFVVVYDEYILDIQDVLEIPFRIYKFINLWNIDKEAVSLASIQNFKDMSVYSEYIISVTPCIYIQYYIIYNHTLYNYTLYRSIPSPFCMILFDFFFFNTYTCAITSRKSLAEHWKRLKNFFKMQNNCRF